MKDVQITFHGLDHSDALEALIREKTAKLEQLHDRIQRIRVVVEQPHRSHTKGNGFQLKVEIGVPGEEIVVRRALHDADGPQAADHVVRESFSAAQRLLTAHADKQHAHR